MGTKVCTRSVGGDARLLQPLALELSKAVSYTLYLALFFHLQVLSPASPPRDMRSHLRDRARNVV